MIWPESSSSTWTTLISSLGPLSFFIILTHFCGYIPSWWNQHLILLHKLLECVQLLPDEHLICCLSMHSCFHSQSVWYPVIHTHTQSVFAKGTLPFHWRAKLMHFKMASSWVKLKCWASFSGCSQYVSCSNLSSLSKATAFAKQLASTHTFSSQLSTHPSLWVESSYCTESTVSNIICGRKFQLSVVSLTVLWIMPNHLVQVVVVFW